MFILRTRDANWLASTLRLLTRAHTDPAQKSSSGGPCGGSGALSLTTARYSSPLLFSHLSRLHPIALTTTQCDPFTVNWGASDVNTGPPFILFILPFDVPPAIVKLPDSSFDATMKTGNHTLDKLPLNSGAQFAVTMDDGYGLFVSAPICLRALTRPSGTHLPTGRSTEGVSLIQTVGSSSDASCLIADVSLMSPFLTLTPTIPSILASDRIMGILHDTGNHPRPEDLSTVASLVLSIVQRRTVRHKRSGACIFEKAHKYFSRPASNREPEYFGRWRCKDESAHQSPAKVVKVTCV